MSFSDCVRPILVRLRDTMNVCAAYHHLCRLGGWQCYHMSFSFVKIGHMGYINLAHFFQKKLYLRDIGFTKSDIKYLKRCDNTG